ncbi:MAG: ATPase, T2SS/T4P/T4SS family [Nitrospiraceae bacterium]|nr:ATPase, T2SS/T4P/T4SS family [Nitrospiraceae bacterium]
MAEKLGQILLRLGYISDDELGRALRVQTGESGRRKLGDILMELRLKEEELLEALSIQSGLPIISEKEFPETLPIDKLSFAFLKENAFLPLSVNNGTLSLAIADTSRRDAVESIRASFGCDVKLYLAKGKSIISHLDSLYASRNAMMQRLIEGVIEEEASVPEENGDVSHLKDLAQEKGIIQLVNLIIENAVKDRASDIHVEPEETLIRVRYRIDGILYDKEMLPAKMQPALSSRIKLLSRMNIAERRLPQDGRIRGSFAGRDIDIRVSTLPTVYGESIVMRLLDREASFISLEEIGFDGQLLERYGRLIKKPYGMVLITGPTGSGKTTTLYASLVKLNSPEKKIITVEEPVEYLLRGINQIQVRPRIGLSFANGLRHIVRQDPDIIMVGEIRDLETASISIHAALTGHLLFSTLHTNDSASAITRLVDMGVEPYLVSSTLAGVMAQRLVRRICPYCKVQKEADPPVKAEGIEAVWEGRGCERCNGTGYRGRVAIFELLDIDDEFRELITRNATSREMKDKAVASGMRTLRKDGLGKVRQGITTIDEVYRVTQIEL